MREQNKKYLSLYLYKGKIGHLYARENKKDLHIHAQRNGLSVSHVCIGLCFFCMYFYPTASWVLYLNTAFFICPVRIKKHFSLSTVEQILIREKQTPPEFPMAFAIISCNRF